MQHIFGAKSLRPAHIFWATILVLALVSSIAFVSTRQLLSHHAAWEASDEKMAQLEAILSDLKDVETGSRGFALTEDPQFLEAYELGKASSVNRIRLLQSSVGNESSLSQVVRNLDAAAAARMALADKLVDLTRRRADRRDILAASLSGKQTMDRIRQQVASSVAEQHRIYTSRKDAFDRQAVLASAALIAGVALSLVVLVWQFSRLNREISRRRKVEDELRLLNSELEDRVQERTAEVKRAGDLLDSVVENLPDMVLLKEPVDGTFRYLLVNAAGERLIGRDRSEIIGRTERDLFPPDEASAVAEANRSVAESGEARSFTDRRLTTPTGVRIAETRMVPILDGSDRRLILAIVRDVTDAKARESQLRELQRMDTVGRMTGGVAHDFNNLLAVIMGSVELIRDKTADETETAALADEALGAVRRGADLVRRLLAFARKQHLEPVDVDLNDRLPTIIPLLQRTLGENVRVQVNSSTDLWHARIDPTQVDDALVNLAVNARDAMPTGGTLTIETANVVLDGEYSAHHVEVEPGEYVMLAVSDTGIGMAAEVVARAFEPFFTTKGEGKGTGLGLSQVFGWVKQSGGHIKIYSEIGHGTTIKLYLPRAIDAAAPAERRASDEPHVGGDETVLLVEDNPNVRRTVKRQLNDLGYATIEAEDGQEALRLVDAGVEFDLLLTDVVMPGGLNGYELAEIVERLRPSSRILFTSGYTELAAAGLESTRKGPLISKPYSRRDLGRAIRSALDEAGS
jgi:PAS domain S-box-containing protein